MPDIQLPPPAWVAPAPKTTVTLDSMPLDQVDRVCHALGVKDPSVYACSLWGEGGFLIIVPKVGAGGVTAADQQKLKLHETAHGNGWPADHPSR